VTGKAKKASAADKSR